MRNTLIAILTLLVQQAWAQTPQQAGGDLSGPLINPTVTGSANSVVRLGYSNTVVMDYLAVIPSVQSPSAVIQLQAVGPDVGNTTDTGTVPATGVGLEFNGFNSLGFGHHDGSSTGGNALGLGAVDLQMPSCRQSSGQIASGLASFAFGCAEQASGQYSVAMGDLSIASGQASVAMGFSAQAFSNYTNSFGYKSWDYYRYGSLCDGGGVGLSGPSQQGHLQVCLVQLASQVVSTGAAATGRLLADTLAGVSTGPIDQNNTLQLQPSTAMVMKGCVLMVHNSTSQSGAGDVGVWYLHDSSITAFDGAVIMRGSAASSVHFVGSPVWVAGPATTAVTSYIAPAAFTVDTTNGGLYVALAYTSGVPSGNWDAKFSCLETEIL